MCLCNATFLQFSLSQNANLQLYHQDLLLGGFEAILCPLIHLKFEKAVFPESDIQMSQLVPFHYSRMPHLDLRSQKV